MVILKQVTTKNYYYLDFGFVEFEDKRDAEEAMNEINGKVGLFIYLFIIYFILYHLIMTWKIIKDKKKSKIINKK